MGVFSKLKGIFYDEVVVEEPVVVEEVKPSEEVLLLTEIRDLLSKRNNTEE